MSDTIEVPAVCPLMSIGSIRPPKEPPLVSGPFPPEPDRPITVGCVGPSCGFFVPNLSPQTGAIVGGVCGVRLAAAALAGIRIALEGLGQKVEAKN